MSLPVRLRRAPVAILSVLAVVATGLVVAAPAHAVPGAGSPVFINEIHYDNVGTDSGEAIEVAAPAGTDLSAWSIVRYNGATAAAAIPYGTSSSLGVAADAGNGWGFVVVNYPADGVQNGANDGLALVNGSGSVVQLLSYEGTFTASTGPAAGMTSTDIGVTEGAATPVGSSLQLTGGPGNDATDFDWAAASANTFGQPNTSQTFITPDDEEEPTESAPAVETTTPANNAFNVARDANVTVTFSEPVTAPSSAFSMTCAASGPRTFALTGSSTTYTLDPDGTLAGYDNCTVTVTAGQVSDVDGNDPPDTMTADHSFTFTTVPPTGSCEPEYTPTYRIQGSGETSPLVGKRVATRGVVVGDYEGAFPALRGFYLQDLDGDDDASTSDGLFVFNFNRDDVSLGQVVWVVGAVGENQGQTQITSLSTTTNNATEVCTAAADISPTEVVLPATSSTYLERFEGMLTEFTQELTVTETFQLGRFGQIVMSSGGRLVQPTNVVLPGAPAMAMQAENDRNRIVVDDELQDQNRDPILFGRGGDPLTAANTLRSGDTATGIVGILTYTWGGQSASPNSYRLRPVNALGGGVPDFQAANPRPEQAQDVGGSLRVASFNVLNYFNTFNDPSTPGEDCTFGFNGVESDCRGADNAFEFERQAVKIVDAIVGLDADVVGLIEIENDGYGPDSAIQDLTNRINAVVGAGTYQVLNVDALTDQVNAGGTDAIKTGFIYRSGAAIPVGTTAALNTGAFGDYTLSDETKQGRNRPAITQAFQDRSTGGRAVVTVNHLKSKGSSCSDNASPVGSDPERPDGQANCNLTRLAAAEELVDWLAGDPTGTGDPDSLIIGDLNSYAMEDPIRAIKDAGYVDLLLDLVGDEAYSYVFDGQSGYLDHALASPSLREQVTGTAEWHINADEPTVLDYNTDFKPAAQVASLYAPDAYRSSDHDPVLIGLDLTDDRAGRITGGGWFVSPTESANARPDATGRTDVSVSGHYAGGQKNEAGGVTLTFPAGGIDFASTSVEWVVVNSATGQLGGTGTLNGVPGYRYQAWIVDGSPDEVRMRILDPAFLEVYDSRSQSLRGGQLKVRP